MKGDDIIILVLLVFICIITLILLSFLCLITLANYIERKKRAKDTQKKYKRCLDKLMKMQKYRDSQNKKIAKEIIKIILFFR